MGDHPRTTTARRSACASVIVSIALAAWISGVVAAPPWSASATELVGHGTSDVRATPPSWRTDHSSAPRSFTISGSVSGLFPGAVKPLRLTVGNPNDFAIRVSSITTTVHSSTAACSEAYVRVARYPGGLAVAAHGSAWTVVAASMQHIAPNGCQGARFTFDYSGQATQK